MLVNQKQNLHTTITNELLPLQREQTTAAKTQTTTTSVLRLTTLQNSIIIIISLISAYSIVV